MADRNHVNMIVDFQALPITSLCDMIILFFSHCPLDTEEPTGDSEVLRDERVTGQKDTH